MRGAQGIATEWQTVLQQAEESMQLVWSLPDKVLHVPIIEAPVPETQTTASRSGKRNTRIIQHRVQWKMLQCPLQHSLVCRVGLPMHD
jgi:hypothetical protein